MAVHSRRMKEGLYSVCGGDLQMVYRAYIIDPTDGHFLGFYDIEAPDDEAAVSHAKNYMDGRDVEIWRRHHRVARINCQNDSPSR